MRVERIILSVDDLGDDIDIDGRMAPTANLRVDRTYRPEDIVTVNALGDGIVGCFVGNIENGTPAVAALHLNADGSISHDRPRVLSDVSSSAKMLAPSA